MLKNRIMLMILAVFMVLSIIAGKEIDVLAADELECVDGSYLLMDEFSEVTVGSMTRGIYLKSGSSMISKEGTGKLNASGDTVGQMKVSKISVTVRVERLVNGRWQAYTSWSATNYNSAYVSTTKTLTVPSGYYYRVYSTHTAGSDSSGSFTDGIYI